MSTQTSVQTIQEEILRDVIGGRLTEADALLWIVLLHNYEIHLRPGVVTGQPGNGRAALEAVLPPQTQRGAAGLIAALWPDREDKRANYAHWYWEFNAKTPYEDLSDVPVDKRARLEDLQRALEQHPSIARVVAARALDGPEIAFMPRQIYQRREIHDQLGGQWQGRISTPKGHNVILLFSGEVGEQYGYADGWSSNNLYLFTGEGQQGDMEFSRGNKAIRNHLEKGKDIHLFEIVGHGSVRYIGQMTLKGFHFREMPDIGGNIRRTIVFELAPVKVAS